MKILNILIVMFSLLMGRAWADTAYIPPNEPQSAITRTSNGNPIAVNRPLGGGVTYSGSVDTGFTIKTNRPHYGSAQKSPTPTATKAHPTTFTGTYGEKARGTITTQTTVPKQSALTKGFGVLAVGAMATSHHQNLQRQGVAEQISRGFSDGDWGAVAAGIGKVLAYSSQWFKSTRCRTGNGNAPP